MLSTAKLPQRYLLVNFPYAGLACIVQFLIFTPVQTTSPRLRRCNRSVWQIWNEEYYQVLSLTLRLMPLAGTRARFPTEAKVKRGAE